MNIIIFKIKNHVKYNGIEDDNLNVYDKFYQEKKSNNPETYNFQDYNGYCYGYASLSNGVVNLSNLKESTDNSLMFDNALVVFVADCHSKDANFIVGWYKNAQIFNLLQKKLSYPSVGRDLYYNVKAKSKDCFLLPVTNRHVKDSFKIKFEDDKNFYIITNNNNTTNNNIKNNIINFIDNYEQDINEFANIILTPELLSSTIEDAPDNPISLFKRGHIYLYNENNFIEAIKYFNTALLYKDQLEQKAIIDIHYFKALAFQNLHDFKNTKKELEIVLDYAKYDLTILKTLIYLNMSLENYGQAVDNCTQIINTEPNDETGKIFLEEIGCLKSECLIKINKQDEAKKILEDIIKNTDIEPIKNHCLNILSIINN